MKNFFRFLGIISMALVIGFTFAACDDGNGITGGNGDGPGGGGGLTITNIPNTVTGYLTGAAPMGSAPYNVTPPLYLVANDTYTRTSIKAAAIANATATLNAFNASGSPYAKFTGTATYNSVSLADGGNGFGIYVTSTAEPYNSDWTRKTGVTSTTYQLKAGKTVKFTNGKATLNWDDLEVQGTGGGDTVITIKAIAGVTAPVQGATPVMAITANDQYTGSITWNHSPVTFAYATEYVATITLTAKNGYTLLGVTANFFTVAGADLVTNAANSGVVTATFPPTADDPSLLHFAGNLTISPTTGVTPGTELTAAYSGSETGITITWQWEKDGEDVGTNSNKYTPTEPGTYTVTISAEGYNPKTSEHIIVPTLTGITAAYSGPTVAQTTPLEDLKDDLTVTANYSNGAGKPVTDYELTGSLSITGPSTITVTWEGATTTFTVTAVAIFTSAEDMLAFLSNPATDSNTADTPYNIKLDVATLPWNTNGAAQTAFGGKYVNLDLSGSTFTGINNQAFNNCTSLTGITIPASVTTIIDGSNIANAVSGAFRNCTNLTSVTFAEGSKLTAIGTNAFSGCTDLTDITIPEGVTTIGTNAFYQCSGLTGITIPESVTSIGTYAFYSCSGLTGITIPEGVTSIGNSAFVSCTNLASVTFSANSQLKSIGESAFSSCTVLADITIPESVTSIGNSAFRFTSFTSIIIPEGVTSIGDYTFYNCTGLTSVTIPNSVTSIGLSAFSGCTVLADITIPEGVTSIGNNAFYNCSGLTGTLTIPSSVTSIGNSAFQGCTGLTSVTISQGVTSIGASAFEGCTSLTSVTIPNSVTSISNAAFRSCTGLTSVTIPNSVTSIGQNAFRDCTGLTSLTITEGVTTIYTWAFQGCTSLTSVTIPASVASISQNAFYGCSRLTSVTFTGTIPSSGFFNGTGTTAAFPGDLRAKFYTGDSDNGVPGTYTRPSGSSNAWTKQP